MGNELSPYSEEYLADVVAAGLYPSKEAALEAAVAALREKNTGVPFVPFEHEAAIEQAIVSSQSGRSRPMTADDWARLRQAARDAAAEARSDNA